MQMRKVSEDDDRPRSLSVAEPYHLHYKIACLRCSKYSDTLVTAIKRREICSKGYLTEVHANLQCQVILHLHPPQISMPATHVTIASLGLGNRYIHIRDAITSKRTIYLNASHYTLSVLLLRLGSFGTKKPQKIGDTINKQKSCEANIPPADKRP